MWNKSQMKQINRHWILVCLAGALVIVAVSIAFATPPQTQCIDKAEFQAAIPQADKMARELYNLAQMPSVSDNQRFLFMNSAEYLRISSRLLSLSSWSCKETRYETTKVKIFRHAQTPTTRGKANNPTQEIHQTDNASQGHINADAMVGANGNATK